MLQNRNVEIFEPFYCEIIKRSLSCKIYVNCVFLLLFFHITTSRKDFSMISLSSKAHWKTEENEEKNKN